MYKTKRGRKPEFTREEALKIQKTLLNLLDTINTKKSDITRNEIISKLREYYINLDLMINRAMHFEGIVSPETVPHLKDASRMYEDDGLIASLLNRIEHKLRQYSDLCRALKREQKSF